jgi:hypothetical protein
MDAAARFLTRAAAFRLLSFFTCRAASTVFLGLLSADPIWLWTTTICLCLIIFLGINHLVPAPVAATTNRDRER